MIDFTKQMPNEVMLYGIGSVFLIVIIGLGVVEYYKRKK